MKLWAQRTVKIAVLAAATLFTGGCLLHGLMPHAHAPDPSEFGMGPRRSAEGIYTATLISEEALKTRALQSVRIAVTDASGDVVEGATIAIDGSMPAHGHGLPTRPRVTRDLGNGAYLVEGLRFNMGGWWVLEFEVSTTVGTDRITFNLNL